MRLFEGMRRAALLFLACALAAPAAAGVPAPAPKPALKADRVVVVKSKRHMVLMRGDRALRVYRVALGRYPKGHKTRLGDARTPEGSYVLSGRLRDSAFYKAIRISYPNRADRARARALGVSPGGGIMIHGLPEDWTARELDHPRLDWTQGCIAVTNREIDEIWALVDDGIPIDILP